MSFKPEAVNQNRTFNSDYKYPEPKAGNRPGRISLIVDIGTQEQEPFKDPLTGEMKERKPSHQVVYFADLTSDVVDYGGEIGEQPYRLMLNTSYLGDVKGTTFSPVPPKVEGGLWTFHGNSLHTKLAKATNTNEIISDGPDNMDISKLLGKAARFQVEVTKTPSTKHKDEKGDPVIFTNVRFKSVSDVMVPSDPTDPDSELVEMRVAPLKMEPMIITFTNVTEETVKFLRKDVRETIKKAKEYPGSQMEKMITQLEASRSSKSSNDSSNNQKSPPVADTFDSDVDGDDPFDQDDPF